jgi:hypothetical protein
MVLSIRYCVRVVSAQREGGVRCWLAVNGLEKIDFYPRSDRGGSD